MWTLSETETNLETAGSVIRELEDLLMFLLLKDHILPEAFEEYKIFPNFKKLIFIFGFVAALIFLCNYFMLCFFIFPFSFVSTEFILCTFEICRTSYVTKHWKYPFAEIRAAIDLKHSVLLERTTILRT